MAVTDYSTTPSSNTGISGINIAEGCNPGNINDAIRQMMADVKSFSEDGTFTNVHTSGYSAIGSGALGTQGTLLVTDTALTGANPQTTSNTDAAQIANFTGGTYQTSFGFDGSGNTWIQPRNQSDFSVNYNLKLCPNGGTVIVGGGLTAVGDFAINTNKFTVVASTGNTAVAGTLSSTGNFSINTNKFTVDALTGNTAIAGNVTMNTNKVFLDAVNARIGIGTTSPASSFHAYSAGASDSIGTTLQNGTRQWSVLIRGDGTGSPWTVQDDTAGAVRMQINSSGYLIAQGIYNNTTASSANVYVGGDGTVYRSTSSLKYKKNVEYYTRGLADVLNLRPVFYNSNHETDKHRYAGLIAEEVDAAGLHEFVQYADDGTPDALAYSNMVALCIKAIQELETRLAAMELKP